MIATVGPTTNTASASRPATIRLKVESHLMPLVTPVTAEVRNSTVVTRMIATCEVLPTGSPITEARPLLICSAPMPSEAATPKAVAITASTFTTGPSFFIGAQGSASTAVLTSAEPPRRNWKNAIASATMLYTAQGCSPQWKKL